MKTITEKHIEDFGFAVKIIPAEANYPAFAYTIGPWEKHQHPEIIILGLPLDTMHQILNNVGEAVQKGAVFSVGNFYDAIVNQNLLMYNFAFLLSEK